MSLPNFSVRRPVAVSMFFLGIVLIGLISFRLLPVEMMPNTTFGNITIDIDVRGGIPAPEIEERISKPVEEAVGTVSNLKNILSISEEGNARIILAFEPGTNMDFAALEVREKFNRIRNRLPAEIEKPVIAKYEYTDVPIMILAVTSKFRTPEELRKIVDEKIRDRIQRIEGVARVEVAGGREAKILIEIDQHKLRSFGLSINRLVEIINLNNLNLLAGEIKRAKDKYLVRTMGELQSLREIEDLAIDVTRQGSVIRLKDVATVKDCYLEPTAFARVNTQPVVSIYIQKESVANTVRVSDLVQREIRASKEILDKDIEISSTFNQADYIRRAINQVKISLGYGAILATLVLFIFLKDFRSVFIIASTIPLSLFFTFSMMFFSKTTLNVITLSGLALGIGMLLDNSIVVLENISKKRKEILLQNEREFVNNRGIEKALAIEGANEMLLAIVASTITTLIVFVPLVFINPETRMLYSGIALTIIFSLLASLIVSLTLVPMLVARLRLRRTEPAKSEGETLPPIYSPPKTRHSYQKFITYCLNLRYLVILLALLAFLGAFQRARKLEREFIGIAEQNKFTIFIEMPTGVRLEVSDKIVSKVEEIVSRRPEVKTFTARVEPWSSKIYVELLPLNERNLSTQKVIEKLRPYTEKLEPAFIYYEEPEEIGTKEILIELFGYDYEVLRSLAIQVAQRIQTIEKFTDTKIRMREGRPEMHVNIDKRKSSLFGLSVEDIALSLHAQMRGLVATRYRGMSGPLMRTKEESLTKKRYTSFEERESLRIKSEEFKRFIPKEEAKERETIVRLEEKFRRRFEDLRRISMVTPDGRPVYLSQVASFKDALGPSEIWRKNKFRMVQVSANTGGLALGTAAERVKEVLKDLRFPRDYFWQFGGNYDKMIQNQKELRFSLILSLILVYMILASLFESFKQPFIILFTVPLAAVGAIVALHLTGKPVGMGVLIGAIMLGGIVVNNAIILIDRINFLRRKNIGLYSGRGGIKQAVITASCDRLRPILMTSLTTILGLLPLALDRSESASLWSPLAITVIGGLSLSTFLTLFVIPSLYLLFEGGKR